MARLCTVRFLSAVPAVAARCKHPFCLRPQDLLLRLPLGALLEEVVPGLRSVPAPPALRGESVVRPVKVVPGQAVPRLELVELRGKSLGAACYHTVRPVAFR